MKKFLTIYFIFGLLAVVAYAQRPGAFTTVVTTDTTATSVCVGCPLGSTTPVSDSGLSAAAVTLKDGAPSVVTNKLYNIGGGLFFNGVGLATGSSVSGTTGTLSKFTTASSLGNSIITEAAGVITVNGKAATVDTSATSLVVGGGIQTGTGNVALVNATGKITALSATTLANLSGASLTNLATGNLVYGLVAKTTTYVATTADTVILANGTFTITLYTCTGNLGKWIEIKNVSTGTVTIAGNAAELIDGSNTQALNTQYQALILVCDNTSWNIL